MNREQLRQEKQKQCDDYIAYLYGCIPNLEAIDKAIGQKNVAMIRSGILHKNKAQQSALQQEIEALMKERHALLMQYGVDEAVYKPKWDCPLCEDRGYLADGTLCKCYQQERIQNIIEQSGMSAAMQQYRFENFYLDGFDKPEDIQKKVEWCKQFARQIVNGTCNDSLFLRGDVGRGKTHLSSAIANAVLAGGKTVIYKRAADLFDMIRRYKYEESTQRWHEVLDQLISCDLLVIDDLGAERTTDFVTEQLVLLLEERNYRNKPWIINSNLKLSQIQDSYNTRVSDRIMDRATAILLERPNSYRKEQAEQRMKEL
ncbi:MAG: ATP-binding protein [Peptococcaceae bacterium]|nr:ATP-binding protein [Peptococcaceae bacterium]MBQ2859561.1 ATP-binding protein [Peptococcaceae bacterium]